MASRTRVSFASCNLYNINLPGLPIYSDSDGWDADAYEKKVVWTAAMLVNMDADIWGFQELWHRQALEDVFTRANQQSNYELLVPNNHVGQRIVYAGAVKKEILRGNYEKKRFPNLHSNRAKFGRRLALGRCVVADHQSTGDG